MHGLNGKHLKSFSAKHVALVLLLSMQLSLSLTTRPTLTAKTKVDSSIYLLPSTSLHQAKPSSTKTGFFQEHFSDMVKYSTKSLTGHSSSVNNLSSCLKCPSLNVYTSTVARGAEGRRLTVFYKVSCSIVFKMKNSYALHFPKFIPSRPVFSVFIFAQRRKFP